MGEAKPDAQAKPANKPDTKISGIGEEARRIKGLAISSLASFDQDRFYKFLWEATNPFKADDRDIAAKTIDLRLDELLQLRIENLLLDKANGLYTKVFEKSEDPTLKKLQENYTAAIEEYKKEHKDALPKDKDLEKLNEAFVLADKNKILFEDFKMAILNENKALMTTRVAAAKESDVFVVGTEIKDLPKPWVPHTRRFETAVIPGYGDPSVKKVDGNGQEHEIPVNIASFHEKKLRGLYLDLTIVPQDPKTPKIKVVKVGHDAGEAIKVTAGGATINHIAAVVAVPGQFIPYEKLFEMAMEYYDGEGNKRKFLGSEETKRKGDTVIEVINVQAENQKKHLDKQGNAFLKAANRGDNSFVNLQQPLDNFLNDIANLPTKVENNVIKLDFGPKQNPKIRIKNKEVIEAIESAFANAQHDVENKNEDVIIARKRALSQYKYLKELLHKHPEEPKTEAAKEKDKSSATDIDKLLKTHALEGLIWKYDDVTERQIKAEEGAPKRKNNKRVQQRKEAAEEGRDNNRLKAISMFSEAYELQRVLEDLKNLKEAIKEHYVTPEVAEAAQKPNPVAGLSDEDLRVMRIAMNIPVLPTVPASADKKLPPAPTRTGASPA